MELLSARLIRGGWADCRLVSAEDQPFVWRGQALGLVCKRYAPHLVQADIEVVTAILKAAKRMLKSGAELST